MSSLAAIVDGVMGTFKTLEERLDPDAVILEGVQRNVQLNRYACGPRCTYMIMKYYRRPGTIKSVERRVKTDATGTSIRDIRRVLQESRLHCRERRKARLGELIASIDEGAPLLVTFGSDHEHYSVVYGYSPTHIYVSNPSIWVRGWGQILCRQSRKEFLNSWSKWMMIVRRMS